MQIVKHVFIICFIFTLITCSFKSRLIPIKYIRIENTKLESIFTQNSSVQNLRAEWRNNQVDVLYDVTLNNQFSTERISYTSNDDRSFSHRSTLPTTGTILNMKNNTEISWDDIKDISKVDTNNLTFIISSQEAEKSYKNMVYIPGGSFKMGSNLKKDEQPIHKVFVSSFYMDKYEVTVAEYREFCRATRSMMPTQPYWNDDTHPVVKVSWLDANRYAKWKGKRLPTEAEWEYAARSGSRGYLYAWGNIKPFRKRGGNIADESLRSEKRFWKIWKSYFDGFVFTSPIGAFYSNIYGLYDMTGNVWEWCADWYDAAYYKNSPQRDPKGPEKGTHRVLRGGSWNFGPREVVTTKRLRYRHDVTLDYIGFRCVRNK
jgi:sulfatase modifying factor 1